jgi:spore coat polysaccharide biosynthesis protein SpsF
MKIGIVIQARMGSSRLPGKVLMRIGGTPLIDFLFSRLEPLKRKYHIYVATTQNKLDDELVNLCAKRQISYFRGSEEDVLKRYFQLSTKSELDIIVRLNADSPFIDADFVEDKIQKFLNCVDNFDYGSTIIEPSYPIGMHVEIMKYDALTRAHFQCNDMSLREHVTPYIYQNPKIFKLMSFRNENDLSSMRLTIDYKEDIVFANRLIDVLRSSKKNITYDNIIELVNSSARLKQINQHIYKSQMIKKS